MRIIRVLSMAAAILVCAWFVLGIRQAHEIAGATSVITNPKPSAAQLNHAGSLLHAAGFLNPDAEVDILRGRLQIVEHHLGHAVQTLTSVTRREPRNLEGWIWLAGAALNDPAAGHRAIARIHQLDPLG